jgi:CheY-like chemotaxis protein
MRRTRILVVDDNRVNRTLLATLLESAGCKVDEAASGREAVDGVRLLPYDLVLMDVQMPGMSGIEAAAAIRAIDGRRGAVPIVGISGDDSEELEARCRAAGMNDRLAKPISAGALQRVVEKWGGAAASRDGGPGSLAAGLPPRTLALLLGAFRQDATRRVAELGEALNGGERSRAQDLAHDLAGAAANLGFAELGRVARLIETACAGRGGPEDGLLAELRRTLDETISALDRRLAALPDASTELLQDGLSAETWRKA